MENALKDIRKTAGNDGIIKKTLISENLRSQSVILEYIILTDAAQTRERADFRIVFAQ